MANPYDQNYGSVDYGTVTQDPNAIAAWKNLFSGGAPGSGGRADEGMARDAGKAPDWFKKALSFFGDAIKTGGVDPSKSGKLPQSVIDGATKHLSSNENALVRPLGGRGASSDWDGPVGTSRPGGSEVSGALDFANGNRPAGTSSPQDDRMSPVARPGQSSRSVASGLGQGNKRTPSSPSTTSGRSPVTAAPRDSDPDASSTKVDDVTKDPAVQSLSALLKKYTDGTSDRVDLSPLAALSDSWSHGKLLEGYNRPMGDQEKARLQAQLAENLARRQSDLEWHKARMAQYQDHNDAMRDRATTAAGAQMRVHGVDPNANPGDPNYLAAPRPVAPGRGAGGRGGPRAPTPEQESRQAFSANSGILKNIVMSNYSGDPKALQGATQETHQFVDSTARKYMQAGLYPDYKSAYGQAIKDLPEYMRRGVVAPRGMRYHGANQIQQPAAPQGDGGGAE